MSEINYKINCTPLAVEKAREQIANREKLTVGIRIGLRGGGCNGFSIVMEFVDQPRDKDHIFKFDDVSIYVDPKSIIHLNETTIDYESGLMGKGFKFRIPGQKGACGCGASLTF